MDSSTGSSGAFTIRVLLSQASIFSGNLIPDKPKTLPFSLCTGSNVATAISRLLATSPTNHTAIALRRSSKGRPEILALATVAEVVLLLLPDKKSKPKTENDPTLTKLLAGHTGIVVAFEMPRIAIQLSDHLDVPIIGVDLSSLGKSNAKKAPSASTLISARVFAKVDCFEVDRLWKDGDPKGSKIELCLRAWLTACVIAGFSTCGGLDTALKLQTSRLNPAEVSVLAELVRQAYLLEEAQPKETAGEFEKYHLTKEGNLKLLNSRYKTRVRGETQTKIVVKNNAGREMTASPGRSKGKTTKIILGGQKFTGTLKSIRVIGRQDHTNAERAREEMLLLLLQGRTTLRSSASIRKLWFPTKSDRTATPHPKQAISFPNLNPSQRKVASLMLSPMPLVIVHGPPGTGKTTTIAAAAEKWDETGSPTWIVAQSNVAVKNIAETLHKRNVNFKALVSVEFHHEWHEHLYEGIDTRLIRSDYLNDVKDVYQLERLLNGSRIILSTLSMLSNPVLNEKKMFQLVPLQSLVIDEASQIKIEEFMPIFVKSWKTLTKVCFFGDPKQLPPYGKNDVSAIKTIYDVKHLRHAAHLLDTQYRMPTPLGQFISEHVYDGKLQSIHSINALSCVMFVNASKGEERRSGSSWKNDREIQTMVHLVRNYYRATNFCIITPYDAQRSAIEKALKIENLPWDRVFNVDSFQGNEADFVLVSVVRSGKRPGFLSSLNRMNVMLTRCKKGLVIVTTRGFLRTGGKKTLLGALGCEWEEKLGDSAWVEWQAVSEGTVDLPGAPGPNPRKQLPVRSSKKR